MLLYLDEPLRWMRRDLGGIRIVAAASGLLWNNT